MNASVWHVIMASIAGSNSGSDADALGGYEGEFIDGLMDRGNAAAKYTRNALLCGADEEEATEAFTQQGDEDWELCHAPNNKHAMDGVRYKPFRPTENLLLPQSDNILL